MPRARRIAVWPCPYCAEDVPVPSETAGRANMRVHISQCPTAADMFNVPRGGGNWLDNLLGEFFGKRQAAPRVVQQPAPDRALLVEILEAGRKALAVRYHPDRGGDPEKMVRINMLVDKVTKG